HPSIAAFLRSVGATQQVAQPAPALTMNTSSSAQCVACSDHRSRVHGTRAISSCSEHRARDARDLVAWRSHFAPAVRRASCQTSCWRCWTATSRHRVRACKSNRAARHTGVLRSVEPTARKGHFMRRNQENARIACAQGSHRAWSALISLSLAVTLGVTTLGCSGEFPSDEVTSESTPANDASESAPSNDAAENALIESYLAN